MLRRTLDRPDRGIFADLTRHELRRDGRLMQTFQPELNPLHQQVLQLLDVPTSNYTSA
ncbi:MAG: hypothetical protein ABR615_03390 [Pseudonocardiaceae bacterium]